jgi:hypothetical protein
MGFVLCHCCRSLYCRPPSTKVVHEFIIGFGLCIADQSSSDLITTHLNYLTRAVKTVTLPNQCHICQIDWQYQHLCATLLSAQIHVQSLRADILNWHKRVRQCIIKKITPRAPHARWRCLHRWRNHIHVLLAGRPINCLWFHLVHP